MVLGVEPGAAARGDGDIAELQEQREMPDWVGVVSQSGEECCGGCERA